MNITSIILGLSFVVIFLLGFWLSHLGQPYNGIILAVHKLISVAVVVFIGVTIYQIHRTATLSGVELAVSIITGVLFVSAIISGGLLSTDKPMPMVVLRIHQITPFLTALSTAVMLYLLMGRK